MATMEERNDELQSVLKSVINVLEDGQKGMAEIGEHLKNERLKRYFLAESLKRASFRGELENVLHRNGVPDVRESGTATGLLYRTWAGLKAKLGGGDSTLLETAEQAEDEAKDAYNKALEQKLPLPVRQLLTEQQTQILISHDFIHEQRNMLKSAA
ncbi:MAG TPA: PA2169 family four-helix-bundle protein [Acidobacteriaceae bacterium]